MSGFARGSFRPVSFRPGSIRPWGISPQFGGWFRPYFYSEPMDGGKLCFGIYKRVGEMVSRCAFGYSSDLLIRYLLLMSFIL